MTSPPSSQTFVFAASSNTFSLGREVMQIPSRTPSCMHQKSGAISLPSISSSSLSFTLSTLMRTQQTMVALRVCHSTFCCVYFCSELSPGIVRVLSSDAAKGDKKTSMKAVVMQMLRKQYSAYYILKYIIFISQPFRRTCKARQPTA